MQIEIFFTTTLQDLTSSIHHLKYSTLFLRDLVLFPRIADSPIVIHHLYEELSLIIISLLLIGTKATLIV